MSISHALVVDDSKSARFALKRLLEEHSIDVSLASSGEEAIEFLSREKVDVVFMDHTMPGMDGLEAVSVIKSNPDTAMIPVMMYTTREGEVYVGQARALGAVGVLPKNVQPHQLFEMLASLGLVKDRRAKQKEDADSEPEVDIDLDRTLDQQAMGIHVQSLVERILEDQHMTLRSDILRSQRSFAKQVAKEIVLEQARAEELLGLDEPVEDRRGGNTALIGILLVTVMVLAGIAWNFKQERDESVAHLERTLADQGATMDAEVSSLRGRIGDAEANRQTVLDRAADGLGWAFGRGNQVPYGTPAFSAGLAAETEVLLDYLSSLGFTGVVRMTSNLGEFCLNIDAQGNYVLADPSVTALECNYLGHPEEASTRVSDRLTIPFARLYNSYAEGDLRLELVALSLGESSALQAYPGSEASAGEWNRVAAVNNRVMVEILPD